MTRPIRSLALAALALVCAPAFAGKWALVISVENYEDASHISRFQGADNDARKMRQVFIEALGVPAKNATLLVSDSDQKPTRAHLIEAFGALAENIKPGDDVLLFLAGHGFASVGEMFLAPYDFRGGSKLYAIETTLGLSRLQRLLQQSKPRSLTIFLEMGKRPGAPNFDLTPEPLKPGTIIEYGWEAPLSGETVVTTFSSARPDRPSFFDDRLHRGQFSLQLEKGLRGKAADAEGNITVSDLKRYIEANLPVETKRSVGVAQNPTVTRSGKNAEITLKEPTR